MILTIEIQNNSHNPAALGEHRTPEGRVQGVCFLQTRLHFMPRPEGQEPVNWLHYKPGYDPQRIHNKFIMLVVIAMIYSNSM